MSNMFNLPPLRIDTSKSGIDNFKDLLTYTGLPQNVLNHLEFNAAQPTVGPKGQNSFVIVRVKANSKYAISSNTSWNCYYRRVEPLEGQDNTKVIPTYPQDNRDPVSLILSHYNVLESEVDLYTDEACTIPVTRDNIFKYLKLTLKSKENSYTYIGQNTIQLKLMVSFHAEVPGYYYYFKPTDKVLEDNEPWTKEHDNQVVALKSRLNKEDQANLNKLVYGVLNESVMKFGYIKEPNLFNDRNTSVQIWKKLSGDEPKVVPSGFTSGLPILVEHVDVLDVESTYRRIDVDYPLPFGIHANRQNALQIAWFDFHEVFEFIVAKGKEHVPEVYSDEPRGDIIEQQIASFKALNKWWSREFLMKWDGWFLVLNKEVNLHQYLVNTLHDLGINIDDWFDIVPLNEREEMLLLSVRNEVIGYTGNIKFTKVRIPR